MRTRTLLILSAVCSVLILTAGVVQLLRLSGERGESSAEQILEIGETAVLGGLSATPVVVAVDGDELRVVVELAYHDDGVSSQEADVDAESRFRLLAGVLRAPDADAAGACGLLTTPAQRCTLSFDTADAPGGARLLVLDWDRAHVRWRVAPGS